MPHTQFVAPGNLPKREVVQSPETPPVALPEQNVSVRLLGACAVAFALGFLSAYGVFFIWYLTRP